MDVVFEVEKKDTQKMMEILNKDSLTSRASIVSRDGSIINKDNQFYKVSGTEEQCKKAIEITEKIAKEVDEKTKGEFIEKVEEEESKAGEGLGGIFG